MTGIRQPQIRQHDPKKELGSCVVTSKPTSLNSYGIQAGYHSRSLDGVFVEFYIDSMGIPQGFHRDSAVVHQEFRLSF
jgi:hypothetical protein